MDGEVSRLRRDWETSASRNVSGVWTTVPLQVKRSVHQIHELREPAQAVTDRNASRVKEVVC